MRFRAVLESWILINISAWIRLRCYLTMDLGVIIERGVRGRITLMFVLKQIPLSLVMRRESALSMLMVKKIPNLSEQLVSPLFFFSNAMPLKGKPHETDIFFKAFTNCTKVCCTCAWWFLIYLYCILRQGIKERYKDISQVSKPFIYTINAKAVGSNEDTGHFSLLLYRIRPIVLPQAI